MKTYITPKGKYVVDPKDRRNGYNVTDKVCTEDGIEIETIATFDKPPKLFTFREETYTVRYENSKGNTISPEEYYQQKAALMDKRIDSEGDEGEKVWVNLDDEFEYRRFLEFWKPVQTVRIQREEIEVLWATHTGSGDGHILTSYYQGDPKEAEAWFSLRDVVLKAVKDTLRIHGMTEKDTDVGAPQDDGSYKMYDFKQDVSVYLPAGHWGMKYNQSKYKTRGTVEEMRQEVETIRKDVRDGIVSRIRIVPAEITNKKILSAIKVIDTLASGLQIKAASSNDGRTLRNQITELKSMLEKSFVKECKG